MTFSTYIKSSIGKRYLQSKVKKNMKEWKNGRWASQKQALAVSYSQTREHYKKIKKSRRYKPKKR